MFELDVENYFGKMSIHKGVYNALSQFKIKINVPQMKYHNVFQT